MNEYSDREKVLRIISRIVVDYYDVYVISTKRIATIAKLSKYKTFKVLHELRDEGLVERASQCPAQVSYGDVVELIGEAMPPINGWTITDKGRETSIYKVTEDEYKREMMKLAMGYNEEDNENG